MGIFFLFQSLFAALPPLAQSLEELQALLSDPRVYQSLGSAAVIEQIVRVEEGYWILTRNGSVFARIEYQKGGIGPIQFEFSFPLEREKAR